MPKLLFTSAVLLVCLFCTFYLPAGARNCSGTESSYNASLCGTFCDLEDALLTNETNRIALSITFFPLEDNPPEFVKVTYDFGEGTEPQVWYWSTQTSHFLHPFEVLQFLTLFFNKPEPYYTSSVTVTLRPECADTGLLPDTKWHTNRPRLQLLTQRLKLYAERGDATRIVLRDDYDAKAYDRSTLSRLLSDEEKATTNIIICMAVFVVVFSVVLVSLMLLVFFCSTSHTQSRWLQKVQGNQPAVFSFTLLSFVLNVYILAMASSATAYWIWRVNNNDLFHETKRSVGPLGAVLVTDILCFIWWFIVVIFASCIKSCKSCSYNGICKGCSRSVDPCKCTTCRKCSKSVDECQCTCEKCSKSVKECRCICEKCSKSVKECRCICETCQKRGNECKCKCIKCKKKVDECRCICGNCNKNFTKCTCKDKPIAKRCCHFRFESKDSLIILSLTVLSPIFCVIAHSPYIAIAYLNDGSHASSIFIYYCVLCFVFYGVMWLFFHWCGHYSEEKDNDETQSQASHCCECCDCCCKCCVIFTRFINCICTCKGDKQPETKTWCCSKLSCCPNIIYEDLECKEKCSHHWCFVTLLGASLFLLLGLVITTTCYFVLIPINRSITDAPSRILSIYQSGGFLIGSFIVYKVIRYFYSKKYEQEKDLYEEMKTWHEQWRKKNPA